MRTMTDRVLGQMRLIAPKLCLRRINHIAKRSGSSWAQLCSKAETSTKFPVTMPNRGNGDQSDNVRYGKDLVLGKPKTRELQLNNAMEVPYKLLNTNRITDSNKMSRTNNPANHSPLNKDKNILNRTPSPHTASEDHAKTFKENIKAIDNSKAKPAIELNLKRLRVAKDSEKAIQIERNVLRRSDLSAFPRSKWYNTTSNGSLEAAKDEPDIRTCSKWNLLCPSSEEIKSNVDMVDKTSDKLKATSAINDLNLTSVFAPTELDLNCPPQQVILLKTDDLASRALLTPIRGSPSELSVQHIHHYHHVHHFHSLDRDQPLSNLEKLPYKKPEESPHSRSLNVVVRPSEGNTGNCSLNKSGSGSKYGSNGQNGSSTVVHAEGTNVESEAHVEGNKGSGDASGSASRNRIDQDRYAHKEASLTKFRHKKDQRFGNKARYRNKKRPAE